MASATNDNAIPPIPSLPPLVGIDGRRYEDVVPQIFPGQNSPPAAVALSENTPPPFRINAGLSNQPSAMSSLIATNDVSMPAASRTRGRDNSGSSGRRRPRLRWWRQRDSATSAVRKPAQCWRKLGGGTVAAAASAAVALPPMSRCRAAATAAAFALLQPHCRRRAGRRRRASRCFVLLVQQVSIRKYHLVHHLCVPSRSRGFAGHISISDILRRSLVQSTNVRYIGTVL
jgi:hypothetical protein